jgi:hypothetical protein
LICELISQGVHIQKVRIQLQRIAFARIAELVDQAQVFGFVSQFTVYESNFAIVVC